jgi:hypothetical protein
MDNVADGGRPARPDVEISIEFYTPELAEQAFKNVAKNRPISKAWSAVLERELRAGRFMFTHQGIAFDRENRLFDGQHRLHAIIRSQVGAWLLVVRGLDPEAMLTTDRGRVRSLADTAYIASITEDRRVVQVAAFLLEREYDLRSATPGELQTFLEVHGAQIVSAVALAPRTPWMITAVVQAVIARAMYSADHARLKEFVTILLDPETTVDPADQGAVRLSKYLQETRTQHRHPDRAILYGRALYALRRFVDGAAVPRLKEGNPEDFPIPEVPGLDREEEEPSA